MKTEKESMEALIPVEDRVITLTHYGYIKSQAVDTYRAQKRGGCGISGMTRRDGDFVENLLVSSTHDYICFFTNFGKVYRIKGYEIPESQRAAKGINIVNVLPIAQDERVTAMAKMMDTTNDEKTYLTIVTKRGIIKRTKLSEYRNIHNRGINAINLFEGDEPKGICLTGGEDELIVATKQGMAIRFSEQDIKESGRTAHGDKSIELSDDDEVIGMEMVVAGKKLLTVSEDGKGRRSEFDDYHIQNRGGKGIQNYKNGNVAGIKAVLDDDGVIVISSDGIIIRMNVGEIIVQSRYAGGVRVMRVPEGSRIVNLVAISKNK